MNNTKFKNLIVLIPDGTPDKTGYSHSKGSVKLTGKPVPVTVGFKDPAVGEAVLRRQQGKIVADIMLFDEKCKDIGALSKLTPAVCGMADGIPPAKGPVASMTVTSIGLVDSNSDDRIQPLTGGPVFSRDKITQTLTIHYDWKDRLKILFGGLSKTGIQTKIICVGQNIPFEARDVKTTTTVAVPWWPKPRPKLLTSAGEENREAKA